MLMEKPNKDLSGCEVDIFNGATIIGLFYRQSPYNDNFIPYELDEKGWEPNGDKDYKVWWHQSNPSDPCDLGRYILDYIEELTPNFKEELIGKIVERMKLLNLNRLYRILKSI